MDILLNIMIKAAGWTIVHSLWQSTILYIALYMVLALNPKISARSRYNLSLLTLIGIFAWVLITFYTELSRLAPLTTGSESIGILQSSIISNNVISLPTSVMQKIEQSIPLLVFIYMIGLMIRMAFLFVSYYKIRDIKISGLSDLDSDLHQRFSSLVVKMGIVKNVRFYISDRVSVPLMLGYLKPVVLIPISAITQLETNQLEAIIIHELAHIRRNDYLFNLIRVFIETILFFNPFVWIIGRMVDAERENACDDVVIEMTDAPLIYIETLFQLQELKYDQEQLSMAITRKKYHLLNRIKRIASMKASNINLQWQLFVVLITITVALSLAWIPITKNKAIEYHRKAKTSIKSESFNLLAQQPVQKEQHSIITSADLYATEIKNASKLMDKINALSDTLPKLKRKFKIVAEDENGNKKEYNSLDELPVDMRAAFLKQNDKIIMKISSSNGNIKELPSFSKEKIDEQLTYKIAAKAKAGSDNLSKNTGLNNSPTKATILGSRLKEIAVEKDGIITKNGAIKQFNAEKMFPVTGSDGKTYKIKGKEQTEAAQKKEAAERKGAVNEVGPDDIESVKRVRSGGTAGE